MTGLLLHEPRTTEGPLNAATFRPELGQVDSSELSTLVPPVPLVGRRAKTTRIFQIGFNKCGTRSLYRFLQRSGIPTAHFARGLLACSIRDNIAAGKKPLAGRIDDWVGFTDMQQITREHAIEAVRFFRELYEYYPNSYFILNTRDKEGWIRSRVNHGAGTYARRYSRALGLDEESGAVLARWSEDWDLHHAEVIDFFADKPGRLLVFDIKNDSPQKVVDFLSPDFLTRVEDFRHEGDTASVDPDSYRGRRPVRWKDGEKAGKRRKRRKADAAEGAAGAEGARRKRRRKG